MAGRRPRTPQDAGETPEIDHEPCRSRIAALEADVKALKKQLATRDPLAPAGQLVKRTGAGDLDHLPDQDRLFIEKRLGIKR